ncbi:MAG: Rmt family 16S rRNA (guanine(1405)-N(7))-methyltransferase [Oscillospiraceae bacterium]|nr:Rmt family 16S rRNA (guanine(1405)-N(7))-methyltransferase [Oscillospiraceae bacterium]
MTAGDVYEKIIVSKKYSSLYKPLIMRVCEEECFKYKKDKDKIKAVKNKLHMIYGAFVTEECHKKAEKIIKSADFDILKHSVEIMKFHTSSNERVSSINEFYRFIFGVIGETDSIIDIGCGFNPFSIPYMPVKITRYYALDIDCRTTELLNFYFRILNLPRFASGADIVSGDQPLKAGTDAAFIFKMLPVLEAQAEGRGFGLIAELDVKYAVVTYPVMSLCGKKKGMEKNYAEIFEAGLYGGLKIIEKKVIGGELIYVIKK